MIATGNVWLDSRVSNTNPRKKSFHIQTPLRMITAARAGRVSGSMIRQKICNSLAPSIRAASSRSFGRARKKPVITRTPIGIPSTE
jgi:hypothetical protein